MATGSTAILAPVEAPDDQGAFDPKQFVLSFKVVEATRPVAKLRCDTSDGCGGTCAGSACTTNANNPS